MHDTAAHDLDGAPWLSGADRTAGALTPPSPRHVRAWPGRAPSPMALVLVAVVTAVVVTGASWGLIA